jgi:hypothetical protein
LTPIRGLPDGVLARLRPHLKQTTGLVLASRGECIPIQRREIETIRNRTFRAVHLEDLTALKLPASWLLGALLCPGDETGTLAAWARRLSEPERSRLRFYAYAGTDLVEAMSDWVDADLGAVQLVEVSSWEEFHQRFGADHAIRVYQDHVHRRPG